MGIDSMRVGGGRCPPLLVGGLLLACLMLICNWWTLSSENLELVRQIDELNEQLKISAEERDQCVTLRGTLEQKYKHTGDELASLHVRLEQQTDLKKKNDDLETSFTMCKNEVENLNKEDAKKTDVLDKLRQQEDSMKTQLEEKRDENKKLEEELSRIKDDLENLKRSCNTSEKKIEHITQPKNFKDTGIVDKEEDHEMLEIEDIKDASNHGIDPNIQDGGNGNEDVGGEERDRDQQTKATNEPEKFIDANK